jgi:glycine betaine/proline transport system ATP-binding protein
LLAEVFAPSAESRLPVAVIDAEDHLLGVIPRATLLSAMASLSITNGAAAGDPSDHPATGLAADPTDAMHPQPHSTDSVGG